MKKQKVIVLLKHHSGFANFTHFLIHNIVSERKTKNKTLKQRICGLYIRALFLTVLCVPLFQYIVKHKSMVWIRSFWLSGLELCFEADFANFCFSPLFLIKIRALNPGTESNCKNMLFGKQTSDSSNTLKQTVLGSPDFSSLF